MIQAIPEPGVWQALDPELVNWLSNTVAKYPWLNHLALLAVVYGSRSGAANQVSHVLALHSFLRWAIPDHYADIGALLPEQALAAYFGDPPQPRGQMPLAGYSTLQLYLQRFLESVAPEQRRALVPFLLPTLVNSQRLRRLRAEVEATSRRARKQQAFAVVRRLPELVALGRRRYRWLAELEQQMQQVAQSVQLGQTRLPALISLPGLEERSRVTFRVWDRASWVQAHAAYSHSTRWVANKDDRPQRTEKYFLQLVGDLPEEAWFLRAVANGLLQGTTNTHTPENQRYRQAWHLPVHFAKIEPGLLTPRRSVAGFLYFARRAAAGTPDDSAILFCVEPLLAAAAVGLFALVAIVSTGMRVGELLQVTLDRECMEQGSLPQFDDAAGTWVAGPKQLYWKLYPKGREQRERYLVTAHMTEALLILLDLHQRYCGEAQLKSLASRRRRDFRHARRFPGQYRFVLQWQGQHLSQQAIQRCLGFLLLEHVCRDLDGQPVPIAPHLLRHAVAGWLRNQGIPLEEIMVLLKHVNIAVTDYYSQPSPEELHRQLGPALTALAGLAGIDPASLRSPAEIQALAHGALKRYGALRRTPGGNCAVFTPCEVQFQCATCPHYIPDPARRAEVQAQVTHHAQAIQLFGELQDYLLVEVQRAHLRDWQRIEQEMEALAAVQLAAPPASAVLQDLGLDDLGGMLLEHLDQIRSLPTPEDLNHD
ncbi:MAG: tyrosine-type recombinase/integrase [Anaerolineales bacterium]|nr:tyrosine-type recombinase/integrase [Anaerolineales bacterium]